MKRVKRLRRVLLAVLLGVLSAAAWPWSTDMVVQLFTRPQQNATVPPPGAIAVGREAPLVRPVAERTLANPYARDPQALERGRWVYETYCFPCHGAAGKGDGPVKGGAMLPADLTVAHVQTQRDGALYSTVRDGFGLMPGYGARLTPRERWEAIAYVRTLGEKGAR